MFHFSATLHAMHLTAGFLHSFLDSMTQAAMFGEQSGHQPAMG
jgi:hypothetical protein